MCTRAAARRKEWAAAAYSTNTASTSSPPHPCTDIAKGVGCIDHFVAQVHSNEKGKAWVSQTG